MTAIFFIFACFVLLGASVCALIGYRWKEERYVTSPAEYFANFGTCLVHVIGAMVFIWLYLQVFQVPVIRED